MAYCPHCIFNISCASFVVNTLLFFLLSAVFCCVFLCISSIAFKQKTAPVCFYLHILRRVTESNVPLPVIIILLPNLLDDLDIYDEIYLGYPNYWNTMSMAVYTHLEQYDFTSKTIPHEGSNLSHTVAGHSKDRGRHSGHEGTCHSGQQRR